LLLLLYQRELYDDRNAASACLPACLLACLMLTIAPVTVLASTDLADSQASSLKVNSAASGDDGSKHHIPGALPAKTKKAPVIVSLIVERQGDIIGVRIKDRVAKVARLEDGLLHIVPTSRFESPTRAVDYLMQTRRGEVEDEMRHLLDRVNAALKGYKPVGTKALEVDEEEEEDPVVVEVVVIIGNQTDFIDDGIPNPADRYADCVNKCDNGCGDPLLSGSVENATCIFIGGLSGVVCLGVTITTLPFLTPYIAPTCGVIGGVLCTAAFAYARSTCAIECTQRCS
jgi:hypothetical protein